MIHRSNVSSRLAVLLCAAALASACNNCGAPPDPPPVDGGKAGVTNPAVRSCDVLFQVGGDEVPTVRFGDGVTGEAVPKAPRLALSFVARADGSLVGADVFQLAFQHDAPPVELVKQTCYDAAGAAVAGDALTLQK